MAFWNNKANEDPEKKLKRLKKYCRQVLGLNPEEADKKARELLERELKISVKPK